MTDPTGTPETTQDPTGTPETTQDRTDTPQRTDAENTPQRTDAENTPQTGTEDQEEGGNRNNREAAKYRRQLRETEAQRDALAATVAELQKAEVERIAAVTITKPDALWAAGVELPTLLDDRGRINPDAVNKATREAVQRLGLATNVTPHATPRGRSYRQQDSRPTFTDAFRPAHKRPGM